LFVVEIKAQSADNTFTDARDGKKYKTVKIGTQTWMEENLAYKASGGCWVYNNDENNANIYGYLYDWKTAKSICPAGWHLPSDAEWSTLAEYLGGTDVAGGKMKKKGTTYWQIPNSGATNESGFTALPAGYYHSGLSEGLGVGANFWSATESDATNAWLRCLNWGNIYLSGVKDSKTLGLSVRCIKDN